MRQYCLTVYGQAKLDEVHEIFLRGRSSFIDFSDGDSFDGEGDDWDEFELERAFYRIDIDQALALYGNKNVPFEAAATGGRQLIHWANGLVFSVELDGGLIESEFGPLALRAFGGRTYPDQVDIDSSRPDFDIDTERVFAGGMVRYNVGSKFVPYFYGIVQRDVNDDDILQVGSSATRFDYNSYYIGGGAEGALLTNLRYGLEAAYQGGENLSFDPSNATLAGQTTEEISAWAVDGRLDYFIRNKFSPRFSGGFTAATGDDDRLLHTTNTFGGNQPGTDDNAFNAFGLVNKGYAFSPSISNLIMGRAGASVYPLPDIERLRRFQLGAEFFTFFKFDDDAPIDEPSTDDAYLGFEADVYANWQIFSDLSLNARYGAFLPSDTLIEDDVRHFFYSGVTLSF
ncbi:MAG: alginate export family protein [Opitutales bacterium]